MKTLLVTFLLIIISLSLKAQGNGKNPYDVNFNTVTQQEPFYPKGDTALYSYFRDCIQYSNEAKVKGIDQSVMLSFDVMPDSTIANIFTLNGAGYGIDEQIENCLKSLKYAPGIQNNTKVKMNVILTIPVYIKKSE